ncbi:hypothetical protein [Kitasatospora sp. NPDC056531]|uniref:hypothetical protein n=1 Tax=Kitasatospora sp. NPDC056531 TaxID=3345856 RepID=UPI0036B75EF3
MTRSKERAEDTCPLDYQCRLPLSTSTVKYLADLLRRHLKAIRSRWRILPPGRITVIVLAVLRHDQRLADMAGGSRGEVLYRAVTEATFDAAIVGTGNGHAVVIVATGED